MFMNRGRLSRTYAILWIVTSLLALATLLVRAWR
jgi:hypothetical protein